jgi:hypothetical protein
MARGGTKTGENQAQNIINQALPLTSQAAGQANAAYGQLMPQIQQMLSPGGDPAVTAATMGALGSKYGAATKQALDTAARTRNAASTNATIDQLAQQQGAQTAQTAAQNVASQHSDAAKMLSQIYGMSQDQVAKLLGAQTGANNSYINAVKTGNQLWPMIASAVGSAAAGAGV